MNENKKRIKKYLNRIVVLKNKKDTYLAQATGISRIKYCFVNCIYLNTCFDLNISIWNSGYNSIKTFTTFGKHKLNNCFKWIKIKIKGNLKEQIFVYY